MVHDRCIIKLPERNRLNVRTHLNWIKIPGILLFNRRDSVPRSSVQEQTSSNSLRCRFLQAGGRKGELSTKSAFLESRVGHTLKVTLLPISLSLSQYTRRKKNRRSVLTGDFEHYTSIVLPTARTRLCNTRTARLLNQPGSIAERLKLTP